MIKSMNKDMINRDVNQRLGFYLLSLAMLLMLFIVYLDVQKLNRDVNVLLSNTVDIMTKEQNISSDKLKKIQEPAKNQPEEILEESQSSTEI